MFISRKGRLLLSLVLVLVVLSLVLAGCGGSVADKNGNGNGNGDGGDNGGGDVDLSWFQGAWKSPSRVNPAIEFTIGDLIESESGPQCITHYYKGTVKCLLLEGGSKTINEKPNYTTIPIKMDHISIEQDSDGTVLLFIWAGYDGGAVKVTHAYQAGDELYALVDIEGEGGTSSYATPTGEVDIFTKQK